MGRLGQGYGSVHGLQKAVLVRLYVLRHLGVAWSAITVAPSFDENHDATCFNHPVCKSVLVIYAALVIRCKQKCTSPGQRA